LLFAFHRLPSEIIHTAAVNFPNSPYYIRLMVRMWNLNFYCR
jgi:hypothetical protein